MVCTVASRGNGCDSIAIAKDSSTRYGNHSTSRGSFLGRTTIIKILRLFVFKYYNFKCDLSFN